MFGYREIQRLKALRDKSMACMQAGDQSGALAALWEAIIFAGEETSRATDPRNSPDWHDPHEAGYR